MTSSQTARLREHFLACPNHEISAPILHAAASGKPYGYCGSLSRRISDLRDGGMNLVMRDEWDRGVRHTFYTYFPRM